MSARRETTEEKIARLSGLYQKDPARFERQRQELIRQVIESFPEEHRRRAYGLQLKIEATLGHYKDPVARMNKMVEIFWEQFRKFQEVVSDPTKALMEKKEHKTEGKVIPLRRKANLH